MPKTLVSTSSGRYAAEAAKNILEKGGSAADAVAAASMVQIVDGAGTYVSFAGIMVVLYYEAKTGKVICIDADYGIPAKKEGNNLVELYLAGNKGASALVPGYFTGLRELLKLYGKLSLEEIVTPAIDRCAKPFPATERLEKRLRRREKTNPPSVETFDLLDGKVVQNDLLETLKNIRSFSLDYMITGEWGQKLVKTVQDAGGILSLDDMANYQPDINEAISISYKDWQVYAPPPENAGGLVTLLILKMLERLNLNEIGHYMQNPEVYMQFISGLRAYMPFLQRFMGNIDDDIFTKILSGKAIDLKDTLKEETIDYLWELINTGKLETAPFDKPENTDAVTAIDQEGNIAIMVHSACASTGIDNLIVDGISLSRMGFEYARSIEKAAKRNLGIFSPIIAISPEKISAVAAIHASLFEKQSSVLMNILEYCLPVDAANQKPTPIYPDYDQNGKYAEVLNFDYFEPNFIETLKSKGLRLKDIRETALTNYVGAENLHAIESPLIGLEVDRNLDEVKGTTSKHYDGTVI